MMGRMAPQRAQLRESELQRLKNQGLTENSEAFQRAMTRLDQGDTDANQQALLGATSAYGDIFNRSLAARGQGFGERQAIASARDRQRGQQLGEQGAVAGLDSANRAEDISTNAQIQSMLAALRGQQFSEQGAMAQLSGQQRQQGIAEQETLRQSPVNDFMKLVKGINPTMPTMPGFMAGTGYSAANMAGAADKTYGAQMDAFNAKQAANAGLMKGLFALGGAALGGPMGAQAGSALGGMFGGGKPPGG